MANLKYGSTGSDVKKLQTALIDAGYDVGSTGADGVFGKNTQAAVQAYQKANGLAVDGIAGTNTLGLLYGTNSTPAATTTTQATTQTATPTTSTGKTEQAKPTTTVGGFTYDDFTYEDYSKSDTVLQAESMLTQHNANKPGAYTPVWQDEADSYLSQYQNRDPFSYDFNADALYNQYKDNYIQQGQMAMMDTMGQAAAMTGGYGNSYAQTVGQQVYNQNLNQLNNILPELYGMAYDRYNQEGQDLLNMYGLYMDRENQAYDQYQNELNNWYLEANRLTDNYNTLYNRDYGEYTDKKQIAYDKHLADKDLAWDQYLTNLDKEQTAAELMASSGNYDRLKEVYGLSDEEIAAIKEANTPKATGGTGVKTPTYNAPTDEQLANYLKAAEKYGNSPELAQSYGYMYGVDPNFLSGYYSQFVSPSSQPIDTTVNNNLMYRNDGVTVTVDDLKKQREEEILNRYGTKNGIVLGLTK